MYRTKKRGLTAYSIKRGLKLGLTTLSILTSGGFAFASMAEARGTESEIFYCNNYPFGTTAAYGADGCAETLGITENQLNSRKVAWCGRNVRAHAYHLCTDIVNRATAANWASKNSDAPSVLDTAPYRSQFLRGTTNGVNTTGIDVALNETLNLQTSTFNGRELGGDATDGISSFLGRISGNPHSLWYVYAGIFSGTDVGGFVNNNSGTASWVGSFSTPNYGQKEDFVLEVDFDNSTLSAFVKDRYGKHARLTGEYDAVGIITGSVSFNRYKNNDRNSLIRNPDPVARLDRAADLKGLIGKEGAVGVFVSPQGTTYNYSGGFVARPAEDVEGAQAFLNETCGDATSNLSDPGDPFHEFCFLRKAEQAARIENCTEGSHADTSACERAVQQNSCITNPFKSDCEDDADFRHFYPTATENRIEYCNNTGSALNDPLCQYTEVVTAICADNLFGVGCLNNSSYANARTRSLDVCNSATNSGSSLCRDTNLDNICSYAPFVALCLNRLDLESREVLANFTTCRGADPSDLTCTGVTRAQASSGKADAATWADSLVTLKNLDGISSITSVNLSQAQYRTNQFVEGLENASDVSHLPTRRNTPFTALNLANTLVNSTETLGGESEDGVAFFGFKAIDYGHFGFPFYAGILSGTDLGAPITGAAGAKAVWSGVFQAISGKESRRVKRNFDLTINFIADNAGGTIDAFVNSTGDNYYHLTGNFNSIGVISGEVDYGSFDNSQNPTGDRIPGVLTGLIGEQGAVGAFIANGNGFYAGGFVARNVVDYATWEAEANPVDDLPTTLPNTRNHTFVSGRLADEADSESEKLNLKDATYNGYLLGGERADGVAFFKRPSDSFPAAHYAGVLSDTDLGSLIFQPNTRAYWSGSIRVVNTSGIRDAVDFVLEVAFTDNGGSISAEALNAAKSNGLQTVHLSGTFGYNGVITGTSRVGSSSFGDGKLRGLIGQDGAVGAFVSTAGVEYSGGFVARPHSVNITDLQNYATLETTPSRALNASGGFLKASLPNGQLDDSNRHFPSGSDPSTSSSTIGLRDGDNQDGYQYFGVVIENDRGGEDTRYYAGILATTNLGAPLTAPVGNAPTSAIWEGDVRFIHLRTPNHDTKPTEFYLDFSAGTIGFANDARNGTGTATVGVSTSNLTGVQLTLNGKFGVGDSSLSLGQLGGDMRASTVGNGDTLLPVTGLIGQDGVVGVFVNPSATSGNAGGFTASPQ